MVLIEDARADVVLALHAVPELPLHEEVVDGDAVIVAVVLHVLPCLLDALVVIGHLLQQRRVDRDAVDADLNSCWALYSVFAGSQEPRVSLYVFHLYPSFGVSGQQSLQHVPCQGRHELRKSVLACDDLLVEDSGVGVFKRKVAADHGEEHHSA